MTICWRPHPLPERPHEVGHGLCVCTDTAQGRRLIAHVVGFDWLHRDADALVHYATDRVPVDAAAFAALQAAVACHLREKRLTGTVAPGCTLHPNA